MFKNYKIILVTITAILVTSCANSNKLPPKKITTKNWNKANQQVVNQYIKRADAQLLPHFQNAAISYPPKKIALLTFKHEQAMELWAKDERKEWRYIKTYPITPARGGLGPKLKENDHKIPEGSYRITHFNPFSQHHLSMMINYPNTQDKAFAQRDGRTNLGKEIFIHGRNSSAGCLSIGDENVSQVYVLVNRVGKHNTKIIIAPNDLRKAEAKTHLDNQPDWVPELYSELHQQLAMFST